MTSLSTNESTPKDSRIAAAKAAIWDAFLEIYQGAVTGRRELSNRHIALNATLWVNGEEVARHEGGHTPFSANISRVAGRRGNVVVVRAEDPLTDKTIPRGKQYWTATPEGIFYTATTGIWQTVWLEPLPARPSEALRITPARDRGTVHVEVDAQGESEIQATFDGREVGRRKGSGTIVLDAIHAWSPEAPHLYELQVTVIENGHEVDRVESYFGLRKVETREGRFWLNGAPYVQRLVLDQGY